MRVLLETSPLSQLLCNQGSKLIEISFEEREFDRKCPCLYGSLMYLQLELFGLSEPLALLSNYSFWFFYVKSFLLNHTEMASFTLSLSIHPFEAEKKQRWRQENIHCSLNFCHKLPLQSMFIGITTERSKCGISNLRDHCLVAVLTDWARYCITV